MNAKIKNIKSDLKKVDAHSVKKAEYDELPELTDEMIDRAVYKVDGVPNKIIEAMYETVKDLHSIGLIDQTDDVRF
jgi:dsDNA-specific endonuclease/ATPase MutS2